MKYEVYFNGKLFDEYNTLDEAEKILDKLIYVGHYTDHGKVRVKGGELMIVHGLSGGGKQRNPKLGG